MKHEEGKEVAEKGKKTERNPKTDIERRVQAPLPHSLTSLFSLPPQTIHLLQQLLPTLRPPSSRKSFPSRSERDDLSDLSRRERIGVEVGDDLEEDFRGKIEEGGRVGGGRGDG